MRIIADGRDTMREHNRLLKLARALPPDGIVRTVEDYQMVHHPERGDRMERVLVYLTETTAIRSVLVPRWTSAAIIKTDLT